MPDEKPGEDERMIRDAARAQAQEKFPVNVAVPEDKIDRDVFHEMGEPGLIGITLREAFGCANVRHVAYDERYGA
jgi:glutaryl-CoA dehydrogenase